MTIALSRVTVLRSAAAMALASALVLVLPLPNAAPASAQAEAQVQVQTQATSKAAPPVPRQVGTMSELMVKILYPASDAIFYISTRTPTDEAGWNVLQGQALMVAESANLLMSPIHAWDDEQWMADSKLMLDAGETAYEAALEKDLDALIAVSDALYKSCVTCHKHYRPEYGK